MKRTKYVSPWSYKHINTPRDATPAAPLRPLPSLSGTVAERLARSKTAQNVQQSITSSKLAKR